MRIRLAGLINGQTQISMTSPPGELELDPETYKAPITMEIIAERSGGKVALKVWTSGEGCYFCDRCGDEFTWSFGGECQVIFIQRDEPLPDEMPGDDLRTFRIGQDELDITTEVRDALLLSVPLKLLCAEDCKGLCPGCRANLNREACRCRH